MEIKITLEVPDEYADEDHSSGLNEEGYNRLLDDLMGWVITEGPDAI